MGGVDVHEFGPSSFFVRVCQLFGSLRSPVSWLVAGSTPAPGGPESCWLPLDSQHSAKLGLQPRKKTARLQVTQEVRTRSRRQHKKKLNILTFCLASDARRQSPRIHTRPWECPPPPPALLTQDSMPRERRHLAGVTWEGGLVVLFFCSRGNVLSAPMAF